MTRDLSAFADTLVLHFLTVQAAGQLTPSFRATLAAGVVKLLREQFEAAADDTAAACSICELPLADPALELADGVVTCAPCGAFYAEAVQIGGTVLRARCMPVCSPAPATCGRVFEVAVAPGRSGPIVADTNRCCDACRPAQEAALERVIAADERRRAGLVLEDGGRG